eukprot:jgi/Bigna1/89472/estExt_fgenesh1_pg.C_500009
MPTPFFVIFLASVFVMPCTALWKHYDGHSLDKRLNVQDVQKFILLATPRSGSSWMSQMLEGTDHIAYHYNECFHSEHSMNHCFSEWASPQKKDTKSQNLPQQLDLLFAPPTESDVTHVGFKWMANQHFENKSQVLEALDYIEMNQVKVVALDRSNLLRKCYSRYDMRVRERIGQHIFDKTDESNRKVPQSHTIPESWMDGCLKRTKMNAATFNEIIDTAKDVIVITYSDLYTDPNRVLRKVGKFLGLQEIAQASELRKSHSGSMHDLVKNWGELRKHLLEGPHADQIEEWEAEECRQIH